MAMHRDKKNLPPMLADATLGRLCKWLRIAGIDTDWDLVPPDPKRLEQRAGDHRRWVLTRSRKVFERLGPNRCLLLVADDPLDQIRQVFRHFGIAKKDLQPLSRCSRCNRRMSNMAKQNIIGQVPDYVWQRHERFMGCPRCQRIYWPGTHANRMQSMIDLWFQ
jgi:uncharacterized protein with PIN domain